MKDVEKEN